MSVTIGMEEQIFNLRFQRFSSISEDAQLLKLREHSLRKKITVGHCHIQYKDMVYAVEVMIQTAELGTAAPDIIFLENFCAPELHNIYVAQYIYCTICAIYILHNIYIERQLLDSRLQNKVSVFISTFK